MRARIREIVFLQRSRTKRGALVEFSMSGTIDSFEVVVGRRCFAYRS